jgi:hypothetical protein
MGTVFPATDTQLNLEVVLHLTRASGWEVLDHSHDRIKLGNLFVGRTGSPARHQNAKGRLTIWLIKENTSTEPLFSVRNGHGING